MFKCDEVKLLMKKVGKLGKVFVFFEWMFVGWFFCVWRKEGLVFVFLVFLFIGIVLGVVILIVVMLVMNGF